MDDGAPLMDEAPPLAAERIEDRTAFDDIRSGAPERLVLLGFMGAGKTTVGRLLAERIGWDFVDLDARIEQAEGRSVAEIFAEAGEAHFRALEAEHTAELAGAEKLVLAPGGGWITGAGNLLRLGTATLSIWLQVSAESVVVRASRDGTVRPLLADPNPLAMAALLLRQREPLYARADLHLPTDGRDPHEIVHEIEEHLRSRGLAPQR